MINTYNSVSTFLKSYRLHTKHIDQMK